MAKRGDSVTVRFAQPLRVEAGASLPIRLETIKPAAPPARMRLAWLALLVFFSLATLVVSLVYLPVQTVRPVSLLSGLSVGYTVPLSVAVDDDAVLEVSVVISFLWDRVVKRLLFPG